MFSLIPRKRERKTEALVPRIETPFRLMRKEFETLWDRFFDGWTTPLMELWETPEALGFDLEEMEKEVVVRAELPGFEPTELDVRVRGDLLTIEAKHEEAKGEKKEYAHVKRLLTLPKGTETDKIEARYHSGVLEVHVPKTPEVEGRRIEVKA